VSATPSPTPNDKEVENFQVVMWTGIVLALTLFAAILALLCMDIGRDPVLYSQFKNENDMKRD
jgi:hypothetical protein